MSGYKINVDVSDGVISTQLIAADSPFGVGKIIARQTMNTKDELIRKALIEMGWTPPNYKAPLWEKNGRPQDDEAIKTVTDTLSGLIEQAKNGMPLVGSTESSEKISLDKIDENVSKIVNLLRKKYTFRILKACRNYGGWLNIDKLDDAPTSEVNRRLNELSDLGFIQGTGADITCTTKGLQLCMIAMHLELISEK